MAHELETFADGATAFASARLSAWHRLGTVTDACMTAEQIMANAHLAGWNVRKLPLQGVELTADGADLIDCPDRWMTVRTNPVSGRTEYLGVVGDDYTVVQNEEAAEVLNRLVDESGAHFETAGSLRGGRSVFVTMKLPATMTVGGVDDLDLYLAASTSHDGKSALRVDATPVRIVCANTQRAALRQTRGHYVFRHTTTVHSQISQAREAIGLVWKYLDAFQQAADRMINEALTMGQFEAITAQLWPVDDDATDTTRRHQRQRTATLRYLIRDADTQQGIAGTRWAGYQAVTEYLDHYAPARDATVRAASAVTGRHADLKTRAFDLLTV